MSNDETAQTATYFWSGSNRAGEIAALAKHGKHIGVAVDALDKKGKALAELAKVAKSLVFVDSGAFGEVRFDAAAGAMADVNPISDPEWRKRLATYRQIAASLGSRCYLAPDKVGDQAETLRRLERYAQQVRELRALGANIIVPIQKGETAGPEFDRECSRILGFTDYVRGIPSKKAAATVSEIAALSRALPADARIHLLGLGPFSKRYGQVIDAIGRAPELVFCDSVRIKALVGRANGPGGGPRALTRLADEAKRDLGLSGKARLSPEESRRVKFAALDRYFSETEPAAQATRPPRTYALPLRYKPEAPRAAA
jgi:hypothetical protein